MSACWAVVLRRRSASAASSGLCLIWANCCCTSRNCCSSRSRRGFAVVWPNDGLANHVVAITSKMIFLNCTKPQHECPALPVARHCLILNTMARKGLQGLIMVTCGSPAGTVRKSPAFEATVLPPVIVPPRRSPVAGNFLSTIGAN